MNNLISSKELKSLYNLTDRDDDIFELNDITGIHIIRKYKDNFINLKNDRMFIKLYIPDKEKLYVQGAVDRVKSKDANGSDFYTIVYPTEKLKYKKPTSFFFGEDEGIKFDNSSNKVIFRKKEFTLNEFVDLMEKNHYRDMFLFSRIVRSIRIFSIKLLFFLIDSKYEEFDYIWRDRATSSQTSEKIKSASSKADPLFHYFYIYKNLLGLFFLLLAFPIFYLSLCLSTHYFTISNPFIIFLSLFILYILEKISDWLYKITSNGEFIHKMSNPTLKGRIKK